MVNVAKVVKDLQREREVLNKAIAALTPLAGKSDTRVLTGVNGSRRTLSAAARRKIAAAQRARWAKFHAGAASKARNEKTRKSVRVMSASARRKIAAARRARWAKVRQQKAA